MKKVGLTRSIHLKFVMIYVLLILLAMRASPTAPLLWAMVLSQGLVGYGMASVFAAIPAELFQGRHYGKIFGTLSLATGLGFGGFNSFLRFSFFRQSGFLQPGHPVWNLFLDGCFNFLSLW